MSKGKRAQPHQLGDGPVEEQYIAQMTAVMALIDELFNGKERPRHIGVIIMVFPFGDHEGRCNYMSNGANRDDVVALMKEMVARFEGRFSDAEGTA